MYAKIFSKALINIALFALCAICSFGLFSCNSSYSLRNFVNSTKPSTYFKSVDIHLSGDTLTYRRIRLPTNY